MHCCLPVVWLLLPLLLLWLGAPVSHLLTLWQEVGLPLVSLK
jgi:hypothetical protein